MADRTIAQLQAEWVTRGTIAKLQAQLDREPEAGKRKTLENGIAAQRKLILPDEP